VRKATWPELSTPKSANANHRSKPAKAVVYLLAARTQALALAESCTGGGLTHRVTNVPPASRLLQETGELCFKSGLRRMRVRPNEMPLTRTQSKLVGLYRHIDLYPFRQAVVLQEHGSN
jgi:hypothetical protein